MKLIRSISTSPEILEIYRRLRFNQGLQRWWPGDSSFEVVVGTILTQNTNWENVKKAIANLEQADLLHPAKIVEIPVDSLITLIRPTGFHTQKPFRLKAISQWWLNNVGDSIQPLSAIIETTWGNDPGYLRVPSAPLVNRTIDVVRAELMGLKGVGPETADAILLYALGLPSYVVDAYTRRIFSRLGFVEVNISYEDLRALFLSNLPQDLKLFNDYHAQITTLAKNHCLKTPRCVSCPLREICLYFQTSSPISPA